MDQVSMMTTGDGTLTTRPIGPTFGAEVTGMPIHGNASPEMLTQFIALLHRYRAGDHARSRGPGGFQCALRTFGNP